MCGAYDLQAGNRLEYIWTEDDPLLQLLLQTMQKSRIYPLGKATNTCMQTKRTNNKQENERRIDKRDRDTIVFLKKKGRQRYYCLEQRK
jgi:hypothetical protein